MDNKDMERLSLSRCPTVGELIEKLKKFPEDMKVVRWTNGYYQVHDSPHLHLVKVPFTYLHSTKPGWDGLEIVEDQNTLVLWL